MKRHRIGVLILAILLMAFVLGSKCSKEPKDKQESSTISYEFRKDGELSILGKDGEVKASFDIEIVSRKDDVHRGLQFRESMQENQGMLFIFDGKQNYGFWMKDTYIPLDMLFIDYENKIFQIAEDTTPFSEEHIEVVGYNLYTLEVNAGICKKYSINNGDTITWKRTP